MIPRYADVRPVLKSYPDVTRAERQILWRWYRQASAYELVSALCDPAVESKLERLQRDFPDESAAVALRWAAVLGAVVAGSVALLVT